MSRRALVRRELLHPSTWAEWLRWFGGWVRENRDWLFSGAGVSVVSMAAVAALAIASLLLSGSDVGVAPPPAPSESSRSVEILYAPGARKRADRLQMRLGAIPALAVKATVAAPVGESRVSLSFRDATDRAVRNQIWAVVLDQWPMASREFRGDLVSDYRIVLNLKNSF